MVRRVNKKVSRIAIRSNEYAVFIVSEFRGLQPRCAVAFVDEVSCAKNLHHLIYIPILTNIIIFGCPPVKPNIHFLLNRGLYESGEKITRNILTQLLCVGHFFNKFLMASYPFLDMRAVIV